MRGHGVVFSCAHAAKAGKRKAKRRPSPPKGPAGDRRRLRRRSRPEDVLRQKERLLMESERKRVFLCPSRRRRVRFSCAHRNQRYSSLGSRCVRRVRAMRVTHRLHTPMHVMLRTCTILVQKDRQGRRPVARHCSGCLSELVLEHSVSAWAGWPTECRNISNLVKRRYRNGPVNYIRRDRHLRPRSHMKPLKPKPNPLSCLSHDSRSRSPAPASPSSAPLCLTAPPPNPRHTSVSLCQPSTDLTLW